MSNSPEKSPREIIDAYSPIVRGKKGLLGLALKAVARPLELTRNILGAVTRFPFHFGYENTAGQVLTDCSAVVPETFRRMEKKLQASFNTAARDNASPIERETFLRLADQVRADGEELSRYCTILRTEFADHTERYSFILGKKPLGNRQFDITTLEQGVAQVKEQMFGSAGQVAAEIAEGSKNPVTVRRKPLDLLTIPQSRN